MNPHQKNKIDVNVSDARLLPTTPTDIVCRPCPPTSNVSSVSTASFQTRKIYSRTNSRYTTEYPFHTPHLLTPTPGTQILRLRRLRTLQSRQSLRHRRHLHWHRAPQSRRHPPPLPAHQPSHTWRLRLSRLSPIRLIPGLGGHACWAAPR